MSRRPSAIAATRALLALGAAAALLGGCAPGAPYVRRGDELIAQGRLDDGLAQLEQAARAEPGNAEYRMKLIRERERRLLTLLGQADADLAAARIDAAEAGYRHADALAPGHPRALAGLDAVQATRVLQRRVEQASALAAQGRAEPALKLARSVLQESPTDRAALALVRELERRSAEADDAQPLQAALRKPVTLDFRDANLKTVFDALARSTGINFVFDREVKTDIKVTLSVAKVSIDDIVGVLAATNQLGRKTLNDNTVLIYPNTPAKLNEYAELSVRTFYLANADAKSMLTMLKTVIKTRDAYADEKLNSITMRDTPEAIRLADKLIAAQDLAEPEVVLDVEVLEVKRSRLSEIGIAPPGKFSVLNLVPNPATVINTASGATTVTNSTLTTTQLTLRQLRGVRGSSVGIDNASANFRADNGDTNILANPRIRVRNRNKARIVIGDRVPVITTTSTANVGVSESVSYLDVGLKLEVEPSVYLDNEVGVNVNLEVSSIVNQVKSATGTLTYQIGTRMATTSLRLQDGETQALAGLISDEDRRDTSGAPGAVDLPVLGRLLSSQLNDRTKTEIVLLITPRVVRNVGNGPLQRYEYTSGTGTAVGAPPLHLDRGGRLAAVKFLYKVYIALICGLIQASFIPRPL